MKFRLSLSLILLSVFFRAQSADPTDTAYPWADCQGSAKPYTSPVLPSAFPDTLKPVMINHVGRHGARFPASPAHSTKVRNALLAARNAGTITPVGKKLLALVDRMTAEVNGRWGALDSLGMAEQRGIAARMIQTYPTLFKNSAVHAISSYSPRCIMSMDEFTHQLARMDNSIELSTGSGRRYSPLMRFFDLSDEYLEYRKSEELSEVLDPFIASHTPVAPLYRILGKDFDFGSTNTTGPELALALYSTLAGLEAMGISADISVYLTPGEQNTLWGIFNLRQYLQHSSSTLSLTPSLIAAPLLEDLIATTENMANGSDTSVPVRLRFGHAETLMPLLALMHLPGCYYLTNYFDTVALHWHDFHIVPMAANLQMILFRSDSGKLYLRTDLNEHPVNLIPGNDAIYIPWPQARAYLQRCL